MKLLSRLQRFFAVQPSPAAVRAQNHARAKESIQKMLRASDLRTPYGPNDPDLHAATLALSGPMWNGPALSEVQGRGKAIAARFDNAQYGADMRKHWAMADNLGPDASANPGVRYLLRVRSRYEVANNSYARGIVTTLANDTIGRGPRLHMTTRDPDVNREVKAKFGQWAKEIDLAGKLRTMRMAKAQDGEGFCVQTNRAVATASLDRGGSPVRLNLRIFEADQCATVSAMQFSVPSVDGIELDEFFQPKNYFILRIHPGNYVYLPGYVGFPWDYDTFPANKVCHWFRKDRPELHRGIPELTPALNLFAQLRDYTTSILKSARIQSSWAISIETNAPAGLQEVASVAPMDTFDFEDGMAMTMPAGWRASGLNPTMPDAKYPTFKRELLCEIGRCINMPLCVIAGDSSGYNYASGRLDFQVYRKSIEVDRSECETTVLDKIFQWWIDEACLIEGYLPQAARNLKADMSHQWLWDCEEHVDPTKESGAAQTRLGTLTSNLAIEWQKNGIEWEEGLEQIAREEAFKARMEAKYKIKYPLPPGQGTPPAEADDDEPQDDGEPQDANEPEEEPKPAQARRRRPRIRAGRNLARNRKGAKVQANDPDPNNGGKFGKGDASEDGDTKTSGTHASITSLVKDVVDRPSRDEGEKHRWVGYATVGATEAAKLKEKAKLDFDPTGYTHGIEESAIGHILRDHGKNSSRLASDEVPFEESDFERIPEIIRSADDIRPSEHPVGKNQSPGVEYLKRVNGWFFVLEEARVGRKALAVYTAYKTKTDPRTKTKLPKAKR